MYDKMELDLNTDIKDDEDEERHGTTSISDYIQSSPKKASMD